MPSGQWTLPLVWLPLLSSTSPIVSLPVCWRTSSRKRWKQIPSTWGRNSTTQVPLTGSTAAYSQNQWYWCSWGHGGRLPNGHHSRRCVTFRPKRASSMAKTRCTASRDTVACSSFFKGRLLGGAVAMMRAAGLQLGLAPPEQLGNGIDAVGDVPGVAQIDLRLPPMWPARISACKPSHASGVMRSAPSRCSPPPPPPARPPPPPPRPPSPPPPPPPPTHPPPNHRARPPPPPPPP